MPRLPAKSCKKVYADDFLVGISERVYKRTVVVDKALASSNIESFAHSKTGQNPKGITNLENNDEVESIPDSVKHYVSQRNAHWTIGMLGYVLQYCKWLNKNKSIRRTEMPEVIVN